MRNATYFAKECSTCGRTLQVRIEYLGKRVTCPHCRATILATDSQIGVNKPPANAPLDRVETLIALQESDLRSAQQHHVS